MVTSTRTTRKTARIAFDRASAVQHCKGTEKPTQTTWRMLRRTYDKMTYTELMSELSKQESALKGLKRSAGKLAAYQAAARKTELGRKRNRAIQIAEICQSIAKEKNPSPIINHLETVMPGSTVARIVSSKAFWDHHENLHAAGVCALAPSNSNEGRNPLDVLAEREELIDRLNKSPRTVAKRIRMKIESLR